VTPFNGLVRTSPHQGLEEKTPLSDTIILRSAWRSRPPPRLAVPVQGGGDLVRFVYFWQVPLFHIFLRHALSFRVSFIVLVELSIPAVPPGPLAPRPVVLKPIPLPCLCNSFRELSPFSPPLVGLTGRSSPLFLLSLAHFFRNP